MGETTESWLGSTVYAGEEYTYRQCLACGSLFCDPMPGPKALGQMYGTEYEVRFGGHVIDDSKDPERVTEWLGRLKPGTFLDYGCGPGNLLVDAQKLGWRAIGIELDEEVARAVEASTGARVFNGSDALLAEEGTDGAVADVLHLGDVIEHLTDLDGVMAEILKLVRPGGLLLAQGPLENEPVLFNRVLRAARSFRRDAAPATMPPFHVLLATREGQRALFERFGLEEVEFTVREIYWPAPRTLAISDLTSPRKVGLYALRLLSKGVTMLGGRKRGNRYFYAGRLPASRGASSTGGPRG